ncbi:HAD family hydrolase, partial [Roseburia hominis]
MIKNVIFDVGQVLVAWEPVEAMRALGMDEETVRAVADATVHTSDWDEADRGALSDEELLTGFIRKAPAYEAQIRNFWEHVNRAIYPFPYVGEWMRTLKDKGYRLYILSNYGAWTYAKTKDQSLGFLKDVDGALFSFEVK